MNNDNYNKLNVINVKNKLNLTEGYCNGNSIYVYCLFCNPDNKKTANLRLNVDSDSYYCNCCGENGYAVGLYARCNYISTKVAFKRLMEEEANMQTNLKYIKKLDKRSDSEISIVYEYLLRMLGLNKKHCKMLLQMGIFKRRNFNHTQKRLFQVSDMLTVIDKLDYKRKNDIPFTKAEAFFFRGKDFRHIINLLKNKRL